ncbi:hypothetical protein P3S68_019449 [Capsicum galapagoense]
MEFPKFLIVFLLLIMPFSIASISLGATTNQVVGHFALGHARRHLQWRIANMSAKADIFKKGDAKLGVVVVAKLRLHLQLINILDLHILKNMYV